MCGIVAVIDRSGGLSAEVLDAMRDRLAHRGPDGAGSWSQRLPDGATIGLAHRRLSIIDLSDAASQPMASDDGSQQLVFNGEIYNYVELRDELQGLGVRFRTRSDTEVLLAAWRQWGEECLSRLNGMFAFAIWDSSRQCLFLARDRFGEKPLFWSTLPGGGVAFASEAKALFAHPEIAADVDRDVLQSYLGSRYYEDGEPTFFARIRRLPPAHALVVDARGEVRKKWRYWVPDYTARDERYDAGRVVEEFRTLMERSVRMRLRADVPIGSSLSGGLDSSFIVGLLARLREKDPAVAQNTFSARFDADPTLSEGPFIDRVVGKTGVRAFATTPDPAELVSESRRLHWHQEEPFLSASIYLQWCVMRLAKTTSTTILLDGQGADELLGGYQFYFPAHQRDLLDERRFWRFFRETISFRNRLRTASQGYRDGRRRFNASIAMPLRSALRSLRRHRGHTPQRYAVGVPEPAPGNRLRRQMAEALQYNTLPALLRYADRNAMAFGRETRFPFLDYELVDFCTRLPDEAFVARGWQKLVLRLAGEGVLPPEVQWRADKVGYAAPLDVWLRGPMKAWAAERLFEGTVGSVEGYDRASLERTWRAHQAGEGEHSWALWRWISLNEWLDLGASGAWKKGV